MAALAMALCCALAQAQDFRDPAAQPFVIWPNIPVIRATDLGEYEQDRKVFADLHALKADPTQVLAALRAVDTLQAHHERLALAQLGRSLNVQFIGQIDKQTRLINPRLRKLRFEFAGITPEQLQRASALDAQNLEALKTKAGRVTLVAYITYTRLEGALMQATATFVKLSSGESQSFTVTAPTSLLGEALAREVFDYFHGTRFTSHQNPLAGTQWLTAAPGHADRLVSRDTALRYCQSQNGTLPTAGELEYAEAGGFYGGGVVLRQGGVYHIQSGLYDTASALDGPGRARTNHLTDVPNAYYYCIRHAPAPTPASAARARR